MSRLAILAVSNFVPMPDREAGALRLYRILKVLAGTHAISFCACDRGSQVRLYGESAVEEYEDQLKSLHIRVIGGEEKEFRLSLRRQNLDVVFIEHYAVAREYVDLDEVRFRQPRARIIIDSVDINFHRLFSKARVTGKPEDVADATQKKADELATYRKSDIVIAISDADKNILRREDSRINVEVIPLIHPIPQLNSVRETSSLNLIFVGNFAHAANGDAITYFCREILPLVRITIPRIRLIIVGNSPTSEVRDLADDAVEVRGFVAELGPVYESCHISIAPIRWGGGLKGKISEAMSFGLPVVATSVACEGFGLSAGDNVMIGDTPQDFADAVIRLVRDSELFARVRTNGWKFVRDNYSTEAVTNRVNRLFDNIERYPVHRLPRRIVLKKLLPILLERYVTWRWKKQ